MELDYKTQAREMLRAQLAQHPDEGVRAMNEICEPPEDSVCRVAAALEARDRRNAQ